MNNLTPQAQLLTLFMKLQPQQGHERKEKVEDEKENCIKPTSGPSSPPFYPCERTNFSSRIF